MFDTKEGLTGYINDLKSLNEIIEVRTIYGKIYNKKMNDFVINRTVKLDTFGQANIFSEITFGSNKSYKLDWVSTLQELDKYQPSYSYGNKYVPFFDEVCEQCGERFVMEDLKFISPTWYSQKMMHDGCIGHHYYETERKIFKEIVGRVYLSESCSFKGIKSRYNEDKNGHNRPWFKIQTPDGEILIGKRKRVFSIHWQESYKTFTETFEAEEVTKGFGANGKERYIHAYSVDDAVRYLNLAKKTIV